MQKIDPSNAVHQTWASSALRYVFQNGLGTIVLLVLPFYIFQTLTLEVANVTFIKVLIALFVIIEVTCWLLAAASLYGKIKLLPNIRPGFTFCLLVSLVLFAYSVAYHLPHMFLLYPETFVIGCVLGAAVLQGVILDKGTADNPLPDITRFSFYLLVPVIILSISWFLVQWIVNIRNVRFEDIYITFRYGYNLANGHGITWNVGDPIPSEGYTTFIYVLLSAFFYWIDADPLTGTQLVNSLALIVLCVFCWLLGRQIYNDPKGQGALLAIAILIMMPATAFHIATGMETIFYALTLASISLAAVMWLKTPENQPKWMALLGAAILLSGLTRPDGIIYGGITLLMLFAFARGKLIRASNFVALAITLGLPGAVYFIWRYLYYQYPLPLSFYHKSFVGSLYGHATRSVLFTDFVGMIILVYVGIIGYRMLARKLPKPAYVVLVPSLLLVLYYSRVLAVAGLLYRFFFPYMFPFLLLACYDLYHVLNALAQRSTKVVAAAAGIIVITFLSLAPFVYDTRGNLITFMNKAQYDETMDEYMRIGKTLSNLDKDEVIGIGEVGKIGMILRDYRVVDIVGLNDRYLARNPFSTKYLDERGINIVVTFGFSRSLEGVYADVYRKVGEGFADLETKFSCVGNIRGFDVFIRREPESLIADFMGKLDNSSDFDPGICLSNTGSRWSPSEEVMDIDAWQKFDLKELDSTNKNQFVVTGNDPILRSHDLHVNAVEHNNIVVYLTFPTTVECDTFTFYFNREGESQEDESRSMYVPLRKTAEEQVVVANVRMHGEWKGTISGIRLDPVCGNNQNGDPVQFTISKVVLR